MYKKSIVIAVQELGYIDKITLNCESEAVHRDCGYAYYYDCGKCTNQSIGDDSGTQRDCNNCVEVESTEKTKSGKSKMYCVNYIRRKIK